MSGTVVVVALSGIPTSYRRYKCADRGGEEDSLFARKHWHTRTHGCSDETVQVNSSLRIFWNIDIFIANMSCSNLANNVVISE